MNWELIDRLDKMILSTSRDDLQALLEEARDEIKRLTYKNAVFAKSLQSVLEQELDALKGDDQ